MRRPKIRRDPMAVTLPPDETARDDGRREIRSQSSIMRCHEEETVVGSRIIQRGCLNRIIQRIQISELSKRFVFYGAENRRIDGESAGASKVERQNRKNIVMTRDTRALGNKLSGRALQHRQRA